MSYTRCTTNTNVISELANSPTLSAEQLKAKFDNAETNMKDYINNTLLPELERTESTLRTSIQQNTAKINENEAGLCDKIYPIGSIYISFNTANPSLLFGGTWQQIKDKFLLGVGDSFSLGDTGGEVSHKLTTSELPSHSHTYSKSATTSGSTALTVNQIPSHNHIIGYDVRKNGTTFADSNSLMLGAGGTTKATNMPTTNTGSGQGHTHSISQSNTNTGNTGGNTAHNNMPPYLTVYMWKRTA